MQDYLGGYFGSKSLPNEGQFAAYRGGLYKSTIAPQYQIPETGLASRLMDHYTMLNIKNQLPAHHRTTQPTSHTFEQQPMQPMRNFYPINLAPEPIPKPERKSIKNPDYEFSLN